MERRPVAPVDSLWLHMDTPGNLMVIDSVMMFDEPVDWDRAAAALDHDLAGRYPVFRQVPQSPLNPLRGPRWVADPAYDVQRHLVRATLEPPGDEASLQRYVERQMGRPLPRTRPLWEVHLLDGFGSGAAMLFRFHHALADGTSLARVLLELTDDSPDGDLVRAERRPVPRPAPAVPAAPPPGLLAGLVQGAADTAVAAVGDAVGALTHAAAGAVRGGRQVAGMLPALADPVRVIDALEVVNQTGQVASKLLLSAEPRTVLSGEPGARKRAVWTAPLPLGDLKRTARAQRATVNDVMVAALGGALRRHLVRFGDTPADLGTMVPVNLRPLDQPLPRTLGNRFALVLLHLPVSAADPRARLGLAKLRMDQIKDSPEAVLTFGVIEGLGAINQRLARGVVDFFSAKAFGVTSNVRGPGRTSFFAGAHVTGVLGWAPGAGTQSLCCCLFSFDGTVRVGFKADRAVVPDPHALVYAYEDELAELLALPPVV